ncbi:hypothetical protein B9T31_17425 [Acinetobacter sp. ANC 4558]|nr:hypothetical protein B9T31_17425 [Acinetobacter sp. ANC 4558]
MYCSDQEVDIIITIELIEKLMKRSLEYTNVGPNTKIWRYMDFTKFLDIILNKRLYLRRIDKFNDAYEGYISEQFKKALHQSYSSVEKLGFDARRAKENHLRAQSLLPAYSYASCWYLDELESREMWKTYGIEKNSVAICTTVKHLHDSIIDVGDSYNFYFEKIDYEEKKEISSNWLEVAFRKNTNFAFEQEFRVLGVMSRGIANLFHPQVNSLPKINDINNPFGIHVWVDVQSLVQEVYVSPEADVYFKSILEDVLDIAGHGKIVCKPSSLR